MGIIENLASPSWYTSQVNKTVTSMTNYYRPMLRAGSITPLWHMMIATSVVMYSTRYWAHGYKAIHAKHAERDAALKEYREKHGSSGHH
mmetsp:Transcript_52917/g.63705  ORF Transcript_52917/g.63705 Transcript_52917/m.63705 type:complete len:89 (+) Transcript_52917:123-389(+)|eukprot:CAMPEP_0172494926 /NCGR_PEP_ID=MMETSP1066-20121228/58908_1 /TAXON_ID=671091 /ORGANISM="Coscinodiscus wailesii, Strain CCMP2513" /LENGTH=88 /DNA_ID=CAMNT_0013266261 /DNA_START=124 /DNA_END=390 /DNA_ORIENTATION=+